MNVNVSIILVLSRVSVRPVNKLHSSKKIVIIMF